MMMFYPNKIHPHSVENRQKKNYGIKILLRFVFLSGNVVMFCRELWGIILRDWEENSKKKAKLIRQLVYQGIPEHMRGMAWQCLSGAHNREVRDKYPKLITVCEHNVVATNIHTLTV